MKTSKYKVKIICGYRKEQEYTIDANEAHKAYFLFNNPELRGTFSNGLAIKGSDIQRIVPDYNATMGWNHTHQLTDDDYNQLHSDGILAKFPKILATAKAIARLGDKTDLTTPLVELVKGKYATLQEGSSYSKQVLQAKNS